MEADELDRVLTILRKHKVSQAKIQVDGNALMVVFEPEPAPMIGEMKEPVAGGWKDATQVDQPFDDTPVPEVP